MYFRTTCGNIEVTLFILEHEREVNTLKYTFRGGVRLDEHKYTADCETEIITPPDTVSIPMSQHIGAPCVPLVSVGDHVFLGQKIGDVEGGLGCPVHASVSGTVTAIDEKSSPSGARIKNIVISNDKKNELSPDIKPFPKRLTETTDEELISVIREAGVTGMGGASFPTYAKIASAAGKVEQMIINCAECEPFITANHRLLVEDPASVINGIKILLRAVGVRSAIIAVEDNKLDAVNILEEMLSRSRMISVAVMKTKYPQGDERQLVYALTGRELRQGQLPADAGCVIFNAETCAAVFRAFAKGMPLVSRRVTVSGDCVAEPKNLLVPIGTPFSSLVDYCGGLSKKPKYMISGGPMMGQAQWDKDAPVVKGTSALLVLSESFAKLPSTPPVCIRCGRCVAHCPMRLMPNYIALFSSNGEFDKAEKYGAMSCVECGTCSYGCPAGVPIVQHIRVAKGEIRAAAAQKKAAMTKSESGK